MIHLEVPGWKTLDIQHALCDLNGTLALDGRLAEGVAEAVKELTSLVGISILTADTYGTAEQLKRILPIEIVRMSAEEIREKGEAAIKREAVQRFGSDSTVFIGNGANDVEALGEAALAIVVAWREGVFRGALDAADIIVPSPRDALDLLLNPKRIIATLRR